VGAPGGKTHSRAPGSWARVDGSAARGGWRTAHKDSVSGGQVRAAGPQRDHRGTVTKQEERTTRTEKKIKGGCAPPPPSLRATGVGRRGGRGAIRKQDELHGAAQARAWADGDFDADHDFRLDEVGRSAH
jgi:hypothetical protein